MNIEAFLEEMQKIKDCFSEDIENLASKYEAWLQTTMRQFVGDVEVNHKNDPVAVERSR